MNIEKSRPLIASGYFIAAFVIVTASSDLLMRLLPLRAGETSWRMGAVGLASGTAPTLLTGLFIAVVTALVLGHRWVMRSFAVASVVAAVAILVVVPFFALDILEMRALVRPEGKTAYDMTVVRAVLALVFTAAALVWMGVAGWKSTAARHRERKGGEAAGTGLLVRSAPLAGESAEEMAVPASPAHT
jgi:hypothetical protein